MSNDLTPKPAKTVKTDAHLTRAMACFKKTGHLMPAFLESYERTENQTLSSKEVGVAHDMVTQWKKNPDFMVLFTATHLRAQKKNNDNLKASALQRSVNGNAHYLIRNGQFVLDTDGNRMVAYRDFETQLTMFMLKNRMPDEFRDKFEHEISGQLIVTLAAEFLAVVRRHTTPEVSNSIQKELETLSAKLVNT